MSELLNRLSFLSAFVIVAAFAVHLLAFIVLSIWARRDLRNMASGLDDFTRDLKHRSILDAAGHLSDQVDAFLADINEVLSNPTRKTDHARLLDRINILDEKRRYLGSMAFETTYNICRTMIEAYPLAGVLGTSFAIGAALQAGAAKGSAATIAAIVRNFGEAIWATFAGLLAAIILMFLNSLLEPRFTRLAENRRNLRETVARVKRELSIKASDQR